MILNESFAFVKFVLLKIGKENGESYLFLNKIAQQNTMPWNNCDNLILIVLTR